MKKANLIIEKLLSVCWCGTIAKEVILSNIVPPLSVCVYSKGNKFVPDELILFLRDDPLTESFCADRKQVKGFGSKKS